MRDVYWDDYLASEGEKAINLKRNGEYFSADKIYSNLNKKYPNNALLYFGWAKVKASMGEFETAVNYFRKSALLYEELGNKVEVYQCNKHILRLLILDKNSDEFLSYMIGLSGNENYKIPKRINLVNSQLKQDSFLAAKDSAMNFRHCEWCGKIAINFIYRIIIEPEYFINTLHPDIEFVDYKELKVWTKDGGYIDFSAKMDDKLLMSFKEGIPHIFCSELCEDKFLKMHKIIYRPEIWDSYLAFSLKNNMFIPISISPKDVNHFLNICDNCGMKFPNLNKKFACYPITSFKLEKGRLNSPPELNKGFALSFSDIAEENPTGFWYHININMENLVIKLFCSNECAYDFAKETNSTVSFKNNILKGQMCAISPFTLDINKGLHNPYLFRPSKLEGI